VGKGQGDSGKNCGHKIENPKLRVLEKSSRENRTRKQLQPFTHHAKTRLREKKNARISKRHATKQGTRRPEKQATEACMEVVGPEPSDSRALTTQKPAVGKRRERVRQGVKDRYFKNHSEKIHKRSHNRWWRAGTGNRARTRATENKDGDLRSGCVTDEGFVRKTDMTSQDEASKHAEFLWYADAERLWREEITSCDK
jgi:hypothetical protein